MVVGGRIQDWMLAAEFSGGDTMLMPYGKPLYWVGEISPTSLRLTVENLRKRMAEKIKQVLLV